MAAALSSDSRGGSTPRDLTTWDDVSLLAAYIASRDQEAFAQIAARHGALVYRTCFHQLGNPHDSEDAAQAVFLMLAQRPTQVKTSLAGWLYLAARNTALTLLRARRARRRGEEAAVLNKRASATMAIHRQDLDEGIARLPDRLREPLILCYLEGYRQEDAARMLGCNQSTLSRRATEALDQLRSFLVRRGAVVTPAMVLAYFGEQKALAVPAALLGKLALTAAGTTASAGAVAAHVSALADSMLKGALWAKAKVGAAVLGAVATAGIVSALLIHPSSVPLLPTVERATLRGHAAPLITIAFSPQGDLLATGSEDRQIKLWDVTSTKELASWEATQEPKGVRTITFSPDGRRLASADALGIVRIWDLASRKMLLSWPADTGDLTGLAYERDGATLVSGGESGAVKRWDAGTGQLKATVVNDLGGLRCMRLSPDGKGTLATTNGREVRLSDAGTGTISFVLSPTENDADQGKVHLLAFFADGRTLASANYSGTVTVWDVATGKRTANFGTQKQWVNALAVAPDGLTLASVGGEKLSATSHEATIRLSDTATGAERATLRGHTDSIVCVAFSPDGQTLATGSSDATCKLWMPAKPTKK